MPPAERRRSLLEPVIVFFLALPLLYCSGYVWARATHRLVWYGSFVARPDAMHGLGWSKWELAFAPLCWAEDRVRNVSLHRP